MFKSSSTSLMLLGIFQGPHGWSAVPAPGRAVTFRAAERRMGNERTGRGRGPIACARQGR